MAAKSAKWAEKISRKLFLGGNWKCNGTTKSAVTLINETVNKIAFNQKKMEILISPVFVHLLPVKQILSKKILLSAQNLSPFPNGPFTGEITAEQLKDSGINWVLLGHSERRTYFKESNNVFLNFHRERLWQLRSILPWSMESASCFA
jgi:triosephosphate isomerase